jgi:5-methylcytosine-specific restriction endonuclease McrA
LEGHAERTKALQSLSDDELLRGLARCIGESRRVEAELVAHLAELDERRLYARRAFPSLFAYCTGALHLSEHEAYLRIAVARVSRRQPLLLAMLADGRLHLSGAAELVPLLASLDSAEQEALLGRATHRSKREIEVLARSVAPRPDAASRIRKLPQRAPSSPALVAAPPGAATSLGDGSGAAIGIGAPAASGESATSFGAALRDEAHDRSPEAARRRVTVAPLAPSRHLVQFTASDELRAKLERLKALRPGAGLAELIDQAVTEKLERLEARRFGLSRKPRKGARRAPSTEPSPSRHIPAAVRRAVYARDGGRCRFVDETGRRCPATGSLQFDHGRVPWARGGEHTVENLRLLCPAHNALEAERDYGKAAIDRHRHHNRFSPALGPPRPHSTP